MTSIIKLIAELMVLALRMDRPETPLRRAVSGDAMSDWRVALIRIKREMEAEAGKVDA